MSRFNRQTSDRVSLKFLISNALAGSLIGSGGMSIKELAEVSDARINISALHDVYPGSSERVVLVSGSLEAVQLATQLIWEMIALNMDANGDKSVTWSPRTALENPGKFQDVAVNSKITISASAGGLILGRGGANLRAISEDSGARINMTSQSESMLTQERILTISGPTEACVKATKAVIFKLHEDPEAAQYANRGTTYSSPFAVPSGSGLRGSGRMDGSRGVPPVAPVDEVNTTITIDVPDALVGNILGKQGSTIREIMALSGAKVLVSERGPRDAEGGIANANRVITITGPASATATAHLFVTQKLQQPNQPGRRDGKGAVHRST